MTDYLRQRASD